MLLIATLAALHPLLLGRVVPWRDIPAVMDGVDPLLQCSTLAHSLRHLPWSDAFWNAPWFWPAQGTKALMDPLLGPALSVWVLPGARSQPAWAYNVALVLTLAGAFAATYALARRMGVGRAGAALAAWVFCTGPYAASHLQHLNQLPGPWLPLALVAWLGLRGARGRGVIGPALLLLFCVLAQLVSSLYMTAALGLVLVFLVPTLGRGEPPRWWALVAVAVISAGAIWLWSLPWQHLVQTMEELERGARHVGPFAARPFDFAHAPVSHLLPWPSSSWGRPALYPGLLWPLLGMLGLLRAVRGSHRGIVFALGLAAAFAVLLAFGRSLPVPGLEDELPMPFAWLQDSMWPLRALRAPSRFVIVVHLALALFGGWGAQRMWRMRTGRGVRWFVVGVLTVAVIDLLPGPIDRVRAQPDPQEQRIVEALRGFPAPSPWALLPLPCTEREERIEEARAMLWAVLAQQPVANGSSGAVPGVTAALRQSCCARVDRDCLDALAREGIRWLVAPTSSTRLLPPSAIVEIQTPQWLLAHIPEVGRRAPRDGH